MTIFSVKHEIYFQISAHPIITTTSPSIQNITKSERTLDLKLDCSVSAFPKADAIWQKIDGQLPIDKTNQEPNGTLVIRDVSAEDSGTYACSAFNELGEDQVNFTVTIFGKWNNS